MVQIKVVPVFLISVIVSSCQTPATTAPGTGDRSVVETSIEETRRLCSFVPTTETIVALLGTGQSYLAVATGIAKAICNAVAPAGQPTRAAGTVRVSGVPVRGSFEN